MPATEAQIAANRVTASSRADRNPPEELGSSSEGATRPEDFDAGAFIAAENEAARAGQLHDPIDFGAFERRVDVPISIGKRL
jgi:hypothetical protein